jgi:asparagine synthase (glutamine-hydrolysing)
MGHRRLSVIDPTEASAQPFETGRTVIVFNGEIYNFRALRQELQAEGWTFRSTGDTEVIAVGYEAWGRKMFERLQGMFALAVYDKRDGTMILARDRFGIKPLYIRSDMNGVVAFASEIKALSFVGGFGIHVRSLVDLMSWGHPIGHDTLFTGVKQLPPGALLELRPDRGGIQQIETSPLPVEAVPKLRDCDARMLRKALAASVHDHLVSDVPVALALSGGLDSSVVAALAAEESERLIAFTFASGLTVDPEVDYARMVCQRIGVEHRVLQVHPPQLTELLDRIALHLEVPVANVNIIPTYLMYAAIRSEGFKVILIGEGSDEIFAGYPWHRLAYDRTVTSSPAHMFSAFFDRCGLKRSAECLQDKCRSVLADRRMEWEEEFTDVVFQTGTASLAGLLQYDQTHQLQFTQLQRIDRMAMAHGVEARVPFLYDPVLEAANRLPDHLRLKRWWTMFGRQEKIALAESARDLLPRHVLQRPKFGKGGTVNLWKTPLTAGINDVFLQSLQSARFKESREALSEWIDWKRLQDTRLGNREKLLALLLLMTVGHALRGYRNE